MTNMGERKRKMQFRKQRNLPKSRRLSFNVCSRNGIPRISLVFTHICQSLGEEAKDRERNSSKKTTTVIHIKYLASRIIIELHCVR